MSSSLPPDWRVTPLGEHVRITSGESPSLFEFVSDGTPYFKVEQLGSSKKYLGHESTPYQIRTAKTVPRCSVVFAKRGAAISLNRIRVFRQDSYMDTNLMALTPSDDLSVEYLYYGLGHIGLWQLADATSVPQINNKHIQPLPFPLPPIKEQRAIAEALSDVDTLLAGLNRLIAKKRALKQATMQQLLTGQTRLPGFTGKWKVMSLGELFGFSGGYTASRDELSREGHRYLHYGDIHGSSKTSIDTTLDAQDIPRLDVSLKQVSPDSLLHHGDVVFVDASEDDEGTTKHVVVSNQEGHPFIAGLHTIVAKPRTADLTHEYRHYCFQTEAVRKQFFFYAVGTKVSGISKTNIAKVFLPIPSTNEQVEIASMLTDMESELAALKSRRDKTRALKQAMMQELLTGRIRLV